MQERVQELMAIATDLFSRKPDWLGFYREVFGLEGMVRKLFPSAEQLGRFEETEEFGELEKMMANLRDEGAPVVDDESNRVITVRMPHFIHESLKDEAQQRRISINKLCIAKLTQKLCTPSTPNRKTPDALEAVGAAE